MAAPTAVSVVAGIDVDIEGAGFPVRCTLPTMAADVIAGAGAGIGGSTTRFSLVGTGARKNGHVGRGCRYGVPVDKGVAAGAVMAGGAVGLPGKRRQQEVGLMAKAAVGECGSIRRLVVAGVAGGGVLVGFAGRMTISA